MRLESLCDEGINRIHRGTRRKRNFHGRNECPVCGIGGPLLHPLFQRFDLRSLQRFPFLRGWHDDSGIGRGNTSNEFTELGFSRDQCRRPRGSPQQSPLAEIQTETRLACRLVAAVTLRTVFRQNRPDIPLKIDGLCVESVGNQQQADKPCRK